MSEYSSIRDALMAKTGTIELGKSYSVRIIVLILSFAMNPLIFTVGKYMSSSEIIPLIAIVLLLSLVFSYAYKVIIHACTYSGASSYSEILNFYFRNMDRVISVLVLGFCSLLIFLYELCLTRMLESSDFQDYLVMASIAVSSVVAIIVSGITDINKLYWVLYVSLGTWAICIVGQIALFIMNNEYNLMLLPEEPLDYSNYLVAFGYLISIMNCFQPMTIIYREEEQFSGIRDEDKVIKSIRIALIIAGLFYMIYPFIQTSPEVSGFKGLLSLVIKSALLILHISLTMITARDSILQIICSHEYRPTYGVMVSANILIIALAAFLNIAIFPWKKDEELNQCYPVLSFLSLFVGVILPWRLMMKIYKYQIWKVVAIGLVIFMIILALIYPLVYPVS